MGRVEPSEAKILTSAQDNLALTEGVLDQVDGILGAPRDIKSKAGEQPVISPLVEIQSALDAARDNLHIISERLTDISRRIW